MLEDNMALEGVMCLLPAATYRACKTIGANFLQLFQDRGVRQAPATSSPEGIFLSFPLEEIFGDILGHIWGLFWLLQG